MLAWRNVTQLRKNMELTFYFGNEKLLMRTQDTLPLWGWCLVAGSENLFDRNWNLKGLYFVSSQLVLGGWSWYLILKVFFDWVAVTCTLELMRATLSVYPSVWGVKRSIQKLWYQKRINCRGRLWKFFEICSNLGQMTAVFGKKCSRFY